MLHSMTGFASHKGTSQGFSWSMELRGVNAKGLDLRLRVPDWIDGLEAALRAGLTKAMHRGSVTLSVRVQREEQDGHLTLQTRQLATILDAIAQVESEAQNRGLPLAPTTACDILGLRGVLDTANTETDTNALRGAILADLPTLIDGFLEMRRNEGQVLDSVLKDQLAQISTLTENAVATAMARREDMAQSLRANLARVMENVDSLDQGRLTQEIAMLAVKNDVTEELDRLRAHVTAARDLLAKGSPVGRKLDFLTQEFNREANTLCSKSQSVDLTAIGLDLKACIDQMREQVQNVE